ncbi:type VI secretion system lipoprotein TssJ [Neptunomonas sp.]|uniref:type VI secretion system lipoprotein TssJ n=1 Tax=Neptunomonas sp. TaxID=1971898 RepID=UPI0025EB9164|nr:type VI secretion system lipoprotein TssJ [Neptunomonas sp.]
MSRVKLLVWGVVLSLLLGCSSIMPFSEDDSEAIRLDMLIEAAHDVNFDKESDPSPIEMRIYQLSSLSEFEQADFFTLYNDEPLKTTLQESRSFIISPSQIEKFITELKPETKFIAVVAAYQDIDNATWKDVVQVRDSRGFFKRMISSQKVMSLHALALNSRVLLTDQE